MDAIFTFIGAIGLILITIGIINKNRKKQDTLYILGGLCLLAYSISILNIIFIILQTVFTLAAVYDFVKNSKERAMKKKKETQPNINL